MAEVNASRLKEVLEQLPFDNKNILLCGGVPKKIITKPFRQEDLDVEEKYQEWSKRYWKDFEDTFDKEEHKFEGDGPFAGVTLYSAKPNKERQKAFFEKYKTCPMATMAKDIGLLKEEK